MSFFVFILTLVVLLVILLFIVTSKGFFFFDTEKEEINFTLTWLYPFVKAEVVINEARPVLSIYLFNKPIIRKSFKPRTGRINVLQLARQMKSEDMDIDASYGFRDPSITGIAYGTLCAFSGLFDIGSFNHNASFRSDTDFIRINATAKINIGWTLVNLIKSYIGKPNIKK